MSLQSLAPLFLAIVLFAASICVGKFSYDQFQSDFEDAVSRMAPKAYINGNVTINPARENPEISIGNMTIHGIIDIRTDEGNGAKLTGKPTDPEFYKKEDKNKGE